MRPSALCCGLTVSLIAVALLEAQPPRRAAANSGTPTAAPLREPAAQPSARFAALLRQAGVADDLGFSDGQRLRFGGIGPIQSETASAAGGFSDDDFIRSLEPDQMVRVLELLLQQQVSEQGLGPTLLALAEPLRLTRLQAELIVGLEDSFLAFAPENFFGLPESDELADEMGLARRLADEVLLSVLSLRQRWTLAQLYGSELESGWGQGANAFGGSRGVGHSIAAPFEP